MMKAYTVAFALTRTVGCSGAPIAARTGLSRTAVAHLSATMSRDRFILILLECCIRAIHADQEQYRGAAADA